MLPSGLSLGQNHPRRKVHEPAGIFRRLSGAQYHLGLCCVDIASTNGLADANQYPEEGRIDIFIQFRDIVRPHSI